MTNDNVAAVRNAYEVAERKDLEGWIKLFTPDGVFIDNSVGATYRGRELAEPVRNYGTAFSNMHQNAFPHAGTTMIASPRNTARRARSANFSGAIGRNRSKNLRSSSSLTPARLIRPYWPPVIIGVRITPGQTPTPARRGARPLPAAPSRSRRRRVWWRCSSPDPDW